MSNTHTHHHTHAGPHGPHCEDELRRDVEVKREELGHTVEELASRADVKARARSKLRETKEQAEARRADLKNRAAQAKHRVTSGSASEEEPTAHRPVMPPAPGTSGMTDTGAYRVDQKEEGSGSRMPWIAAGGAAALAACAAGVMLRKGGHSSMGGRHMSRPTMGGHTMGRHAMGSHTMGSLGMRSMASMGALKGGGELLKGRSTPAGRMHRPGGHGGVTGGSAMRGMALKKGAAMAGGAPAMGAKVARQGMLKASTLKQVGSSRSGGHVTAGGLTHALAHAVTPDQGMGHRLEHAMGRGHHHHGPTGLWH
ncbi:DUF3618 domain-containing protein [Streptomyces fragilis]|uniref:DUF3618 domain-containing protein n=1 Tax=Streptomyces fragilis TaxID=67301 RepID=A0ABV2YQZ1_9ACTN|nr:DUF3618 domain-containing protein [Streptomyces fragilis]